MAKDSYPGCPPFFTYEMLTWTCAGCAMRVKGPWITIARTAAAHDKECEGRAELRRREAATIGT